MTDTSPAQARRHAFFLILVLGFLDALTPFTIDLYLPTFSDIARDLNTTVPRVSLSIASYFVGFAIGQIIYGPLLDRFGRKPPIFFGLMLYAIATTGCLMAQSVDALIAWRFVAALGGAATSVAAMAMVRDYFSPQDSVKVFSRLMLVLSVSPLFAPSIGSWISLHEGWRVIFAVLLGFAGINAVLVGCCLPHAYTPDPAIRLHPRQLMQMFGAVMKQRAFNVYMLAGALSFAGLFVFLTGSSMIYIDGFGLTKAQYGMMFALLATGMIGGGQVNNLLIKKYSPAYVFRKILYVEVAVCLSFFLGVTVFDYGLVATTLNLFAILACAGIAYPNAAALALEPFTQTIGTASSLLGFFQMGIGAFLAAGVGLLNMNGALPTAIVMLVSAILAMIVLKAFGKNLCTTRAAQIS